MAQVVAREIGDKIIVKRRPPGGGAVQQATVVIEGITHDINCQAPSWHATYDLAPCDTLRLWKLEDLADGEIDDPDIVMAF